MLENPQIIRILKSLVRLKCPKVVFMKENRLLFSEFKKIMIQLNFEVGIDVNSIGRKKRIWHVMDPRS